MQHKKSVFWKVTKFSCSLFPKVCERSTSPRWDEAFHFLVRDPRDETLTVKVRVIDSSCSASRLNYVAVKQIKLIHTIYKVFKAGILCIFMFVYVCIKLSHSWGQALGSLTLPLREVLAEPDLVFDRWVNLDGALPESQILLRVTLKVMTIYLFTTNILKYVLSYFPV